MIKALILCWLLPCPLVQLGVMGMLTYQSFRSRHAR
jgi:hypothetical protein